VTDISSGILELSHEVQIAFPGRSCGKRNTHSHDGAVPCTTGDRDTAALRLSQDPIDGQAESSAWHFRSTGCTAPVEALEQPESPPPSLRVGWPPRASKMGAENTKGLAT